MRAPATFSSLGRSRSTTSSLDRPPRSDFRVTKTVPELEEPPRGPPPPPPAEPPTVATAGSARMMSTNWVNFFCSDWNEID